MASTWNNPEARKLRKRILASIDTRVASATSRPATAKALRDAMQWQPQHLKDEGARFYGVSYHKLNADQLFQINYAIAWAKAWGRDVSEYFAGGLSDPIGNVEELPDLFA